MKPKQAMNRYAKAADWLKLENRDKPAWRRESEFRQNLGRVSQKSQAKKRRAKR